VCRDFGTNRAAWCMTAGNPWPHLPLLTIADGLWSVDAWLVLRRGAREAHSLFVDADEVIRLVAALHLACRGRDWDIETSEGNLVDTDTVMVDRDGVASLLRGGDTKGLLFTRVLASWCMSLTKVESPRAVKDDGMREWSIDYLFLKLFLHVYAAPVVRGTFHGLEV